MKLEFTQRHHGPYSNRDELFECLNGVSADKCIDLFGDKRYTNKFNNCMEFIGGFTDSNYFNKNTISTLSEEDKKMFLNLTEEYAQKWDKKIKKDH